MKIVEEEKSTENSDGENTPPENEPAPQDKA